MSNVKAGLDDFEGEKLNDVETTLNRMGIALRENETDWRDFYDVLDEIASKWDTFSDIERSQITTALGGTRQRENILVALENWEKVKQYAQTGATAAGTSMEKYDIYLESITAKQEQLTAKTQELWKNLLPDKYISGFLDVGKTLMDILNICDGLIAKLLLLAVAIVAVTAAWKAFQASKIKATFVDAIGSISGLISSLWASVTAAYASAGAMGVLKAVLDSMKSHPIIFVLSIICSLLVALPPLIDACTTTTEEWDEKLKSTKQSLADLRQEAITLNDELQTTKDRIAELEGKENLTLVEQNELDKLKQQNAELQRQIDLNDIAQKQADKEANKTFVETMKSDVANKKEYRFTPDGSRVVSGSAGATSSYTSATEQNYIQQEFAKLQTATGKAYEEAVAYLDGKYQEFAERAKDIHYIPNPTTEDEKAVNAWLDYINEFNDKYIVAMGTVEQTSRLWDDLFARDKFKSAGDALKQFASDGVISSEEIQNLTEDVKNFINYLVQIGLIKFDSDFIEKYDVSGNGAIETTELWKASAEDLSNAFGGLATQLVNVSDNASEASVNIEKMTHADIISDIKDKAEDLASAQQELAQSGYLSADSVVALTQILPDLDQYLTVTANGYKISKEGLDALNAAMLVQYQTALNEAKTGALNVLDQEHKKALSYESTTEEIKKQLQAQLALAKVRKENIANQYKTDDGTIVDGRSIFENKKINAEISAIEEAIKSIDNAQSNYDAAKQALSTITSSTSSSSSSSSSSKQWWETSLDKLKDQLEYNEISMDAYINGIATILSKLKNGSDAWREVNAELQKAKLDNIENQFDRGEITIDQYIAKLTDLRKSYKKNSEGYKELTQTINDAKLENTENWLDKLQDGIDNIDDKINRMGDINTAKEKVKYADLLSDKYHKINSTVSTIQKRLKQGNLTKEQTIALQKKLNELLEEEVKVRDEIENAVRDYYENQKEYAEKQAEAKKKEILYDKEIELYGKQGKELFEWESNKKIKAIEDEIELRQKEREALDAVNEREQLTNDLLEARLQLQNALNNKTTKILKKQADGTWQYEYSANMQDVKSAQEAVADAEKALDDYDWEQGIQDLQDEADRLTDEMERLADAYEETEFYANREYEQTMNSIAQTFGDIDKLVQDWMTKYGSSDSELTDAYQKLTSSNATLEQSIINLATIIEAKYETVGNNGKITTQSFDTGGRIVGSGIAMVHDKERVLTAEQNAYFEKLISNLPYLAKLIDITKFSGFATNKIGGLNGGSRSGSATTINKVECVFPNITTTDGLQRAILDLPRLALQKK